MDDVIQTCKTHSEYTQSYQVAILVPFISFHSKSFGLAYCWVQSLRKTTFHLFQTLHSIQFACIKRSFTSACVLISTFDSSTLSSRMACWVPTLMVKVPLLHQTKHAVPSEWWHKQQHSVPFASCWDLLRAASQNPNKTFQLIVRCTSKMQEDLVDFSSSKTISIAKPSTQINLVNRIFETSNNFNHQWLIVTFIILNANIPSSNSEGEMNEAELDTQERQQNDRIVNINPLPSLPFQKAQSAPNSLIKKNYKFIVVSELRAPSITFGANSVKLIEMWTSQQSTMLFFNGGSSHLIVEYIFSLGSEGSHTACRFIVELDAAAKDV